MKRYLFILFSIISISCLSNRPEIKKIFLNLVYFSPEVIARFPRDSMPHTEKFFNNDRRIILETPYSGITLGDCLAQVAYDTSVNANDITVIGGEKIINPKLYNTKIIDMENILMYLEDDKKSVIGNLTFFFKRSCLKGDGH